MSYSLSSWSEPRCDTLRPSAIYWLLEALNRLECDYSTSLDHFLRHLGEKFNLDMYRTIYWVPRPPFVSGVAQDDRLGSTFSNPHTSCACRLASASAFVRGSPFLFDFSSSQVDSLLQRQTRLFPSPPRSYKRSHTLSHHARVHRCQ